VNYQLLVTLLLSAIVRVDVITRLLRDVIYHVKLISCELSIKINKNKSIFMLFE